MKDMMIGIAGLFGQRRTHKQKGRFIRYMQNRAQECGVKLVQDSGQSGPRSCRNLYLGNWKRAKVLLAVPYDTADKLLWPGIPYYPVNAGKNAAWDSAAKALDLLAGAAVAGAYYLLALRPLLQAGGTARLPASAGMLLCALLGAKLVFGVGNRNNYTRNSADVAVALECQRRLGGDRVGVALLDRSCCGFGGYEQLAAYLEEKGMHKKVIALDCVSAGGELHLHGLESPPELEGVQGHRLQEKDRRRCVAGLFPDGLVLTGGSRVKQETVVRGTRCAGDNQIDLEKMARAARAVCRLVEAQSAAGPDSRLGRRGA